MLLQEKVKIVIINIYQNHFDPLNMKVNKNYKFEFSQKIYLKY